ncbi:MAG: hypothetical protein IKB04_03780 [Clostridia bacterium]|nr:hypothetical protein [Clostridia bacterium]
MFKSTITKTDNTAIPAIVRQGAYSTPIWIQSAWQSGEYAEFICRNGCGHCCTAMAANLRGASIDPHQEFLLCCELWGKPSDQGVSAPFITVGGMVKVLRHLGVSAHAHGVKAGEQQAATDHIVQSLQSQKLVAFISDPERNPSNPFSTGLHYVLALEIDSKGSILIANSSEKVSKGGIQYVDRDTIANSLFQGGTADENMTWGRLENIPAGCTYVVVD